MESNIMAKTNKTLSLAIGATLAAGGALSSNAMASSQSNPFEMTELSSGYQIVVASKEGDKKGAEGKCGNMKEGDKKGADGKKDAEGKCGEGKCGTNKSTKAAKKTEKKADKKSKTTEGKCGQGKCGAA